MSPEFLSHIFDPFSQEKTDARSVYQGTGLGMAITKGLIEQMNGSIEVTSQVGVGFPLKLPRNRKRMRKLLRNMIFVDCICWQLRIMSLMLKS